jgi:hypothetical protein
MKLELGHFRSLNAILTRLSTKIPPYHEQVNLVLLIKDFVTDPTVRA